MDNQQILEYLKLFSDNPYYQAAIVILVGLVLAKLVNIVFIRVMLNFAKRTNSNLDDQLIGLVRSPVFYSILLISLAIASNIAFGEQTQGVIFPLLKTLAVFIWSVFLVRLSRIALRSISGEPQHATLVSTQTLPLFENLAIIFVSAAAIYFIFSAWHIDMTAWLASAGIVGIAVGFAAKDTLANLFSGVFILADGPYKIGDEYSDILSGGGTGPSMVVMPSGDFYMGSQSGAKHQRPRHLVQIEYGFAVAKHEVTVGEFKQFITATNYKTTAEKNKRTKVYDEDTGRFKERYNINWQHDFLGKLAAEDLPVIHVSWHDASAYADWLSSATGQVYRLPSETEFEYLLNANNNNVYPWGDEEPTQIWGNFSGAKDKFKRSRIRWREGFSNYEDGYWGPAPVGSFIQSLFGLYDLSGNVMEWVEDCWHDSYTRAPKDGSAWVNRGCDDRVIRGGNWASAIEEYQIHHRVSAEAELTDPRIGFRVAKTFNY